MNIKELIFEYVDCFAEELSMGDTDKTSFEAWLQDIVDNGRIEKYREEARQLLEWAKEVQNDNENIHT